MRWQFFCHSTTTAASKVRSQVQRGRPGRRLENLRIYITSKALNRSCESPVVWVFQCCEISSFQNWELKYNSNPRLGGLQFPNSRSYVHFPLRPSARCCHRRATLVASQSTQTRIRTKSIIKQVPRAAWRDTAWDWEKERRRRKNWWQIWEDHPRRLFTRLSAEATRVSGVARNVNWGPRLPSPPFPFSFPFCRFPFLFFPFLPSLPPFFSFPHPLPLELEPLKSR